MFAKERRIKVAKKVIFLSIVNNCRWYFEWNYHNCGWASEKIVLSPKFNDHPHEQTRKSGTCFCERFGGGKATVVLRNIIDLRMGCIFDDIVPTVVVR